MSQTIASPQELDALRQQSPDLVLLDVRLEDDFQEGHLPGAINQCVFEMAFLAGLSGRAVSLEVPICVYGIAPESRESATAAAKLVRAGYRNVYEFRGGLEAWRAEGRPLEVVREPAQPPEVKDGHYELDLEQSRVSWVGRNLLNHHWGTVKLSKGHVVFDQGGPVSGEVCMDLRQITCTDLAGDPLHDVLVAHLQSDDFFDVESYPEACFAFQKAEVSADPPGCQNLKLHGELTLRGETRPMTIGAAAGFTPEGQAALQATVAFDRTDWGVLYGSGKFFKRLAGHLVNDHVELQLRVVTAKPVRSASGTPP